MKEAVAFLGKVFLTILCLGFTTGAATAFMVFVGAVGFVLPVNEILGWLLIYGAYAGSFALGIYWCRSIWRETGVEADNEIEGRVGASSSPVLTIMRTKRLKSSYIGAISPLLFIGVLVWIVFLSHRWVLNNNLNEAAAKGDLNRVQLLLAQGADVNGRSMHYLTPLMSAAGKGQKEVALYLIKKGANVNALNGHGTGTVLMGAAARGDVEMVRLLIRNGANVNWSYEDQNALKTLSALAFAKQNGHSEVVEVLKAAGASDPVWTTK